MTNNSVSDISSNAEPPASGPVSAAGAAGDEDFDMFAQSRQSFDQHKQATGYVFFIFLFLLFYYANTGQATKA